MPDIRGLIFDVDGVIADTAEFHYQSWKQLAEEEGVDFTRADNERLRGVTRDVSLSRFTEGLTLDDDTRRAWFQRKDDYFHQRMDTLQPGDELPGVIRLLDEADAAGMPVGAGSASRNARRVLNRLNLLERFDAIGDGYTVANSKPAPDIFVWVAGALGLSPRHVLVIEDSKAGVQAALTGGFYVVSVGDSAGDAAHVVLPDLSEMSLAALLAKLPDSRPVTDSGE
jgi:beta-phosphoglucomutase